LLHYVFVTVAQTGENIPKQG